MRSVHGPRAGLFLLAQFGGFESGLGEQRFLEPQTIPFDVNLVHALKGCDEAGTMRAGDLS